MLTNASGDGGPLIRSFVFDLERDMQDEELMAVPPPLFPSSPEYGRLINKPLQLLEVPDQ